jgi:hypothetical protein
MYRIITRLLLLTGVLFWGCGPITDIMPLAPGEMRATSSVEGSFFANDCSFVDAGSVYRIKASMTYQPINGDIVITIDVPKQAALPYTVTIGSSSAVIDYCLEESAGTCTTFRASNSAGSGTIQITSISPNLEGTFSGTLSRIGGIGTRTLTAGEFIAKP